MIHHLITLSRLLCGPLLFLSTKNSVNIIIISYAIFSDFADGYFARILKLNTKNGAMFDVIADKFFIYCAISSYVISNTTHTYISKFIAFWVLRDLFILICYAFSSKSFESLLIGKFYTAHQFFIIFFLIATTYYTIEIKNWVINLNLVLSFVLGVASIVSYCSYFFRK